MLARTGPGARSPVWQFAKFIGCSDEPCDDGFLGAVSGAGYNDQFGLRDRFFEVPSAGHGAHDIVAPLHVDAGN